MRGPDFEAWRRPILFGVPLVLGLLEVGHPALLPGDDIFATIAPDAKWGMVKLSPDQQAEFVRTEPETFVPAAGAWGRSGCTMVQFATADGDTLGEAMTLAWQGTVNTRSKTKTKPTSKAKPKKGS